MPHESHTAQVSENVVQIVFEGESRGMGRAYTAYCLECVGPHGVAWHGPAHIIGYESAPNAAALDDAWEHDQDNHA